MNLVKHHPGIHQSMSFGCNKIFKKFMRRGTAIKWGGDIPSSHTTTKALQHLHLRNSTTWRLVMGLLLLAMSYLPSISIHVYTAGSGNTSPKKVM